MIDLSEFAKTLDNKPVAVFGLGISNIAAIGTLVAAGVDVVAWDDDKAHRKKAEVSGARLVDFVHDDLSKYACLVLAPGVPFHRPAPHPVVVAANKVGLEIICDLEILHRCDHGRMVIGITGTNGKSTITALMGHILKECGMGVSVGGNIGTPALAMEIPDADGVVVLEISSFQMDLCPTFTPDIAVHLNLSMDHLDRHGSMEAYMLAKQRMFAGAGHAVICADDEYSRGLLSNVEEAGERKLHVISGNDNNAVFEVIDIFGVDRSSVSKAIDSFTSLPHRQFLVRSINNVDYINDSKATNVAAAAYALSSSENIYWIAGGRLKEGGLDGLGPALGSVKKAFLIGEAMDEFRKLLAIHNIDYEFCNTLDNAVLKAYQAADRDKDAATVLLSPACASFDQFASFEARGDMFTKLVADIRVRTH